MSAARTFGSIPFRPRGIAPQSLGLPAAAYPGRVATDSDLIVAVDQQQTRLAVPLNATDTVMTVADPSMIVAYNLLSIDNEIVKTTGPPAGNAVPISRGFDGTTPAVHLASAPVSGLVDAYHHNGLAAEIKAIEQALGANLSHLATSPWVVAAPFAFSPQSPGGSLVAGANQIPLSPVPPGVNGTDTGHYVYISGGTGTAEAALIIGGTAVGGAASGNLIIQCANSHSGAWTIGSATGGIQEAVASLPAAGGCVVIAAPLTLFANVSDGGKTSVVIFRLPGAVIAGAFTILLSPYSPHAKYQVFHNPPDFSAVNTLVNGTQFDIGGFPDGRQFNFTTGPAVQALLGTINIESGALHNNFAAGIAGYARVTKQSQDAVGLFGSGVCAGPLTQAWGANIVIGHDAGDVSGSNLVGIEIDTNHSAAGAQAAATVIGLSVIGNHPTALTGPSYAVKVARAAPTAAPFTVALDVEAGAATIGLSIAATHETNNNVASQKMQQVSRSPTGTTYASAIFLDASDVLWLRASSAGPGIVALDPGGAGAPSFNSYPTFNQSNVPLKFLPVTVAGLPAAPQEGMLQVITDALVNTWGAAITGGGGSYRVLCYFNGSAWTVVAK